MKITPVKTGQDYEQALHRVEELWGAKRGTPEGDEFEVWVTLIEAYEAKFYPIDAPNPIEAIKYTIEEKGLKRADIAKYFGAKSLVSDVLNGRKNLTLKMIKSLHRGLGIPYDVLIAD